MEVTPYHEGLLPRLTQLVNDHMRLVPPGWTLTQEQVAYVVSKPNAAWIAHFPEDEQRVFESHTVCLLESQQVIAAANWFFSRSPENQIVSGILSWLFGAPNHANSLDALIGAFIGQAVGHGCASTYFCPRFGFGVGWFGIPGIWPHMIESIQKFGFEVEGKWVIMTGQVSPENSDSGLGDFTLNWQIDEAKLQWELEARAGRDLVGECQAWGIPAHFRGCPGFDEWITVEWLGVEEPYRRKRLASRLLREQMRFQARRGIKNVIVWTETNNTPARKLNESFGFSYGPECWVFQKNLR
jgi:GNAT superfamily N-acetyltransferase